MHAHTHTHTLACIHTYTHKHTPGDTQRQLLCQDISNSNISSIHGSLRSVLEFPYRLQWVVRGCKVGVVKESTNSNQFVKLSDDDLFSISFLPSVQIADKSRWNRPFEFIWNNFLTMTQAPVASSYCQSEVLIHPNLIAFRKQLGRKSHLGKLYPNSELNMQIICFNFYTIAE